MNFYKEAPPRQLSEYDIEFFEQDVTTGCMEAIVNAHIHTAVEILYITAGVFRIDSEGEQADAFAGDIVLFRSNTVHSVYHLDESFGQYYVLKLTSQFLFQSFRGENSIDCVMPFLKGGKGNQFVFKSSVITKEIYEIRDKMINEYNGKKHMMFSMEKAYACAFVVSMYREFFAGKSYDGDKNSAINENMVALIHKSVEYINENYASNITPVECAKAVNLSYSYYAKLFHLVMGKSFKEYLLGIRLAKAYNILLITDLSVTDIALTCGYKSPAYFTAEYKKHYGITPSETRKLTSKM